VVEVGGRNNYNNSNNDAPPLIHLELAIEEVVAAASMKRH
jgi:hypothetical protein